MTQIIKGIDETINTNICKDFKGAFGLVSFNTFLSSGVSFFVVLISFVIRTIFIILIKKVGFNKNSEEAVATMWWILIVTFVYFGPAYLIAVWNIGSTVKGVDDSKASFLFTGIYTDFTSEWFNDIGTLIAKTTAINSVFPIIEFTIFLMIRVVKRCID